MILTGKDIFDRGLIEGAIDRRVQEQMCGVDLTVAEIKAFPLDPHAIYDLPAGPVIDFDNSRRSLPQLVDMQMAASDDMGDHWYLRRGAYLVTFNEVVHVPPDCAAIARPRSTLLRCGATVETALWDPGYNGRSQSLLVVHNPNGIFVTRNARLVQMVFVKLDKRSERLYDGVYQGEGIKK